MNKSLLILTFALAAAGARAEVLTPAQALSRLETSEAAESPAVRRLAARSAAMPARIVSNTDGTPQLYLFNSADGGLMLLSAESDAMPLLGFTDSHTPGAPLPPALEYMMECYAAEINAVRTGLASAAQTHDSEADMAPIDPICTTRWDQTAPYNAQCPTDDGGRCVTGCVATAMAQVLKAYGYPAKCSGGEKSYTWNNKTLKLNFDDVSFDWDAMKDSYTSSQSAPEVAKLMKACGYAAEMNYSSSASGANSAMMAQGLVQYFGYDCTLSHQQREWYHLSDWQQMVYDELAQGYPVYYDGANPDNSVAHAFVVDGYKGNGFFHLNWGWGGMSDGYFLLSALDPAAQGTGGSTSGYDRGQGAILGMRPGAVTEPKKAPLVYAMYSTFNALSPSVSLNSAVSFGVAGGSGPIYNFGSVTTARCQASVKFVNLETGDVTYLRSGENIDGVGVYSGFYCNFSVIPTRAKFPEGKYEASLAIYNPYSKEYFDVHSAIGSGSIVPCEVKGTTMFFSDPEIATARVESITTSEQIYNGVPFDFSAVLTTDGSQPFYGPLVVNLYSRGKNTVKANLGTFIVEVDPAKPTTASCMLTIPASTTAGLYDIKVATESGTVISDAHHITVDPRPEFGTPKVTRIQVTDKAKNQLTFVFSMRCSTGLYANSMYAVLTNSGETAIIDRFASPITNVTPGSSVKATITCDFAQGIPGNRYTVYPFYVNEQNQLVQAEGNSVTFTLADAQSGIIEVETDGDAPIEFYDLNGRRISEPANGIFIRRQGSETTKIVK